MAVVMIQEQPEMFRTEMYDAVNQRLGVQNDPPAGLLAHTLGQDESGTWRVVDIWESREAHDRFTEERLRPALVEMMRENGMDPDAVPEPVRVIYDTYDAVVPAQARA